jgi:hypothetical protein
MQLANSLQSEDGFGRCHLDLLIVFPFQDEIVAPLMYDFDISRPSRTVHSHFDLYNLNQLVPRALLRTP